MIRNDAFEQATAIRGLDPLADGIEILDQIGHAGERPVGQARRDGRPGLVVHAQHDRVERGVPRVDPVETGLKHLFGRHLAGTDQTGKTDAVIVFVIRKSRHLAPQYAVGPQASLPAPSEYP